MKIGIKMISMLIFIVGLIYAFQIANQYSKTQDLNRIQETITQLCLKCYSIEGHYPKDIHYLKEHYGLLLNEKEYQVTYHRDGDNLQPVIRVYAKEHIYE
ncbi:MAG: hypothetical protein ACLUVC_09765 [Longibaculum sp.]